MLPPRAACSVSSCVSACAIGRLFATPWTVARQAPLSVGFSRQESRSGLPFPSPGDLPYLEFEPASPALAGGFLTTGPPGKPLSFPLVMAFSSQLLP